MAEAAQAVLLKTQVRKAVEDGLLAYMLHLSVESMCKTMNLDVRADILPQLDVAAVIGLKKLDSLSVARAAKQMQTDGYGTMKAANVDDMRLLVLAVCLLVTKLVEEGLYTDKTNVAVLHSMELLLDAEEAPEMWGEISAASVYVDPMFNRLMLLGYFSN